MNTERLAIRHADGTWHTWDCEWSSDLDDAHRYLPREKYKADGVIEQLRAKGVPCEIVRLP